MALPLRGARRHMAALGPEVVFAVAAGLLALAVFAGWRGMRPPNPHKGPRLVPWRWIMLLSATVALIAAVEALMMLQSA